MSDFIRELDERSAPILACSGELFTVVGWIENRFCGEASALRPKNMYDEIVSAAVVLGLLVRTKFAGR
jgi:hypothetical protein